MSDARPSHGQGHGGDAAPGDQHEDGDVGSAVRGYLTGLALAAGLTIISFATLGTSLIWGPGIPVALIVFAIAQMGVHLVFFLHITTSPDNTNNIMALAFGVLIVLLLIGGSLFIMTHMNQNMMPMGPMRDMQR